MALSCRFCDETGEGWGGLGKYFHAIPAMLLGSVERGIGLAKDLRHRAFRTKRRDRDPHADRGCRCPVGREEGIFAKLGTDLIGASQAIRQVTAWQNDQELLATVAAHDVVGPQVALQSSSHFFQDLVAGSVT